jgi:hypothetical protein
MKLRSLVSALAIALALVSHAQQSLPNPPPARLFYGFDQTTARYWPIAVDSSGNILASTSSFTPNQIAAGASGGYYMGTAPTALTAFGDSIMLCQNPACTNPSLPGAPQGMVAKLGVPSSPAGNVSSWSATSQILSSTWTARCLRRCSPRFRRTCAGGYRIRRLLSRRGSRFARNG